MNGQSSKLLVGLGLFVLVLLVGWWRETPNVAADPLGGAQAALPQLTTTPTVTPTASATPVATGVFSVTVDVLPAATKVAIGAPLTVTVQIENHSIGCQYPVYDLTLSQVGPPIFAPITPMVVGPGVASVTVYTLTASLPGSVRFRASAYGERNCDDFWQWHYVDGLSAAVTVTGEVHSFYLPFVEGG